MIASEAEIPMTTDANEKRLKILFLPADNIEPAISRCAYMARGLAQLADVYYVAWPDPRSAYLRGEQPGKSHTLACAARSLAQRFHVKRPTSTEPCYRVSASILLDAILYRVLGRELAAKVKYAYNGRTLKALIRELKPDVVFSADGYYFFPALEGDHVNVCDVQDDIEWWVLKGKNREYVLSNFRSNLAKSARAYIVSEAAQNSFNRNLPAPYPFVPVSNGADFDEIRGVSEREVRDLRAKHGIEGKYVVSYIGTNPKFDPEFAGGLFAAANERLPDVHFVVVGAIQPLDGYPNVTWTGSVAPQVAAAYYNLSDAGTILRDSRSDPFLHGSVPLKIIQYSAARKPVVGFLPEWASSNQFANLFEMRTADTQEWCERIAFVRDQFQWTANMEESWAPYSWQAICRTMYDDMCELCRMKSERVQASHVGR